MDFFLSGGLVAGTDAGNIAILPVGREILTGRVLDTNSRFLAQRLFALGLRVVRICAVDDDPGAIGREVRRCRAEGAGVVVTTGGLGPTPDDRTLEGIARATGRAWREDPSALDHVRRRYDELHRQGRVDAPGLGPDRARMARLPSGARILDNDVGTAPGIDLRWGRVRIFCLPGVPSEMQPMAERWVFPVLGAGTGHVLARRTLEVPSGDESVIAAAIRSLQSRFPAVLFKPDPQGFRGERRMTVHLEVGGAEGEVDAVLDAAAAALLGALE